MFRRALILLLVLLLPLKVAAAGVVTLIGTPGHAHMQAHADDGSSTLDHGHHAGCQQEEEAPANSVHDHACPHLGMVSIATFAPIIDLHRAVAPLNAPPAPHFSPVVPDVPAPIPLALSAR